MKYLILTAVGFLLSGCVAINENIVSSTKIEPAPLNTPNKAPVEKSLKDEHVFGDWKVSIKIDDFEGEVKPMLSSDIYDVKGSVIGRLNIGYFAVFKKEFLLALISIHVNGLSEAWPDCDYEFTQYKIDDSESEYYPKTGYACPSLIFNEGMANKFKKGSVFRFSASGKTGIVSLAGFAKAWNYTLKRVSE